MHAFRPSLALLAALALAAAVAFAAWRVPPAAPVVNERAAQPASPNQPMVIETAPYAITKPGAYQLQSDLKYPGAGNIPGEAMISIAASDVTLDLNGHTLTGMPDSPGTFVCGISVAESENLQIRNGTVRFCQIGLIVQGNGKPGSSNQNALIADLLVTHCYHTGIELRGLRNGEVSHCRVNDIGGSTLDPAIRGIVCESGGVTLTRNAIAEVTAGTGGTAFGITATADTFVVGNTIFSCPNGIRGGKIQNNLTSGCARSFVAGVDAGGNN